MSFKSQETEVGCGLTNSIGHVRFIVSPYTTLISVRLENITGMTEKHHVVQLEYIYTNINLKRLLARNKVYFSSVTFQCW